MDMKHLAENTRGNQTIIVENYFGEDKTIFDLVKNYVKEQIGNHSLAVPEKSACYRSAASSGNKRRETDGSTAE